MIVMFVTRLQKLRFTRLLTCNCVFCLLLIIPKYVLSPKLLWHEDPDRNHPYSSSQPTSSRSLTAQMPVRVRKLDTMRMFWLGHWQNLKCRRFETKFSDENLKIVWARTGENTRDGPQMEHMKSRQGSAGPLPRFILFWHAGHQGLSGWRNCPRDNL